MNHVAWRPYAWSFDQGTPAAEPISLADVKAHCRVSHDDEDGVLSACLKAARAMVERSTNRLMTSRSVVLRLGGFPSSPRAEIVLRGGIVTAFASVTYVDPDGVSQLWDAAAYEADLDVDPARLRLAWNGAWPAVRDWGLPVSVAYTAGYPEGAVPDDLRHGMLMIAGTLYDHREVLSPETVIEMPFAVRELIAPHAIRSFG